MSTFTPYIHDFSKLSTTNLDSGQIDTFFNTYTMLNKPKQRNAYKLSLAQIIHYLVDFGIGYNSECETILTTQQQFSAAMYVNRHESASPLRPATVADLKYKVKSIVDAMLRHIIKDDVSGMEIVDNIYPTYLFTLDETLNSEKLLKLTGQNYEDVTEFVDFAYTGSDSYTMPMYRDGYVPIESMLVCPTHTHTINEKEMSKSIQYKWSIRMIPQQNMVWKDTVTNIVLSKYDPNYVGGHGNAEHADYDSAINPVQSLIFDGFDGSTITKCSFSSTINFEKPDGISCFANNMVLPKNTVTVNGENKITIRYPGRRYRLFKLVDA